MSGPTVLSPALQQELRLAVERIERRAYVQGWGYGLVCGLLTGGCTAGLALWLWQVATASWVS